MQSNSSIKENKMNNKKLISWPSIKGFANLRTFFNQEGLLLEFEKLVKEPIEYRAKIKLHGTNAGIQIHEDGTVIAQSRESLLINGADNYGFAKFVEAKKEALQHLKDYCIFGEWTGKGIQSGVSASEVNKFFAVFAATKISTGEVMVEPSELQSLIGKIPEIYILPWASFSTKRADISFTINWKEKSDSIQQEVVNKINMEVEAIEKCDPWILNTFSVKGTGEGLVFYPMNINNDFSTFENLVFKAKGEQHRVVKSSGAATVNPEVAASIDEFVKLVLTEARLVQGAATTSPAYEKNKTGLFVNWVLADVLKETQAEMVASGLDWKQLQKPLSDYARKWYLSKS